jgi:pyruvate ferredoxin oxidoreductase alpha subunit
LIQAYKIAEDKRVLLPIMVCMDGFILTHTMEPVDLPGEKEVRDFLPDYKPTHAILDTEKPMTIGPFTYPEPYFKLRKELSTAVDNSKKIISEINEEFGRKFKRKYGNGLIEEYKNDKDIAIVSMGSVVGTIKEVVDSRKDVGLVKIRCYRPFPKEELVKVLKDKKIVLVIEKNIALGIGSGSVLPEIRSVLYELDKRPKLVGFIAGLGGTDIRTKDIEKTIDDSKKMKDGEVEWLI